MNKISLVFCFTLLCSSVSWSATVSAVKGQKALIDLEGADVHEGDEFFLLNPTTHKKVAIIRIKQIKNNKAVGDILKGHAEQGYALQAKASSAGAETTATVAPAEKPVKAEPEEAAPASPGGRDLSFSRTLKPSYGILGEYLMDSMQVKVTNALKDPDTVSMSGSGFGVGGFYEYVLTRDITLRLLGAVETFNAKGTSQVTGCDTKTSAECDAKIMYLSAYGLGKYYLRQDKFRLWAGAGAGFLLALSKSSTALNAGDISTNQVLTLALGMDWQLSRKTFVPISIEYNYFPPSDTVTANVIAIKAGYGWQ